MILEEIYRALWMTREHPEKTPFNELKMVSRQENIKVKVPCCPNK